jgi:hypothetical protein
MARPIDRLGRSLIDLLETIKHLGALGVGLYLDQQHLDTTTPQGKLLFQITGAFAEFERSMIQQRVHAGLKVVKDKLARDGKLETRRGAPCAQLWVRYHKGCQDHRPRRRHDTSAQAKDGCWRTRERLAPPAITSCASRHRPVR